MILTVFYVFISTLAILAALDSNLVAKSRAAKIQPCVYLHQCSLQQ